VARSLKLCGMNLNLYDNVQINVLRLYQR